MRLWGRFANTVYTNKRSLNISPNFYYRLLRYVHTRAKLSETGKLLRKIENCGSCLPFRLSIECLLCMIWYENSEKFVVLKQIECFIVTCSELWITQRAATNLFSKTDWISHMNTTLISLYTKIHVSKRKREVRLTSRVMNGFYHSWGLWYFAYFVALLKALIFSVFMVLTLHSKSALATFNGKIRTIAVIYLI